MSSYIAFELDAMEQVPNVAAACSLTEAQVGWGMAKLWRWCWREKTATVTLTHLRGFFGVDVSEALEAFGFIERLGPTLRVKGAERYLRIAAGRSKGGHAAKGNLVPGAKQLAAENQPRGSPETLSAASGLPLGLSATSEQRAATSEQLISARVKAARVVRIRKPKPDKPADPRHYPLKLELIEIFKENQAGAVYPFGARDAGAVTALLAIEPVPERISTVWRKALRATGYPLVRTLPELVKNYAHFVSAAVGRPGVEVFSGPEHPCARCSEPATAAAQTPTGDVWLCYANGCLEVAQGWQRQHNVDAPWLTDLAPWLSKTQPAAPLRPPTP